MVMKIGNHLIGEGHLPLMFAEEGQANQGNFDRARDMCRIAAAAGADGIEFQLFLANDLYVRTDPGHSLYQSRELSEDQIRDLVQVAHHEGILFQAAALSPRMVDFCLKIGVDSLCVNATDMTNPIILDVVSDSGLPFWVATLMATMEEIDWTVSYLNHRGCSNFGLLHGQHVMSSDTTKGVSADLLQLGCIELFKQKFGVVTGFVDHTATVFVPSFAFLKGASVVMKHLAPMKDWRGPDSVVCLDPEQWAESCGMLKYAAKTLGSSKELSLMEIEDRSAHRRGLYTVHKMLSGSILTVGDLIALRPGKSGTDPRMLPDLLGRRVKRDLSVGHMIQYDDLD
jgi:N,N'-diacetyllegionaminate synthase